MRRNAIEIATFLLALVIPLLWAVFEIYGWPGVLHADFSLPILYGGDELFLDFLVKRVAEVGNLFSSVRTGYPFGSVLMDYPTPDFANYYLLAAFAKLSGSIPIAEQIFYLLTFPLAAATSYVFARKFGARRLTALVVSTLYALAPFHFYRIGHLLLTMYWMAPFFFYLGYNLFTKSSFAAFGTTVQSKTLTILALILIPFFGVYYATFGMLVILFSGFVAFLQNRKIKVAVPAIAAALCVVLGVLISSSPFIVYRLINGVNSAVAQRGASESEIYGLKIIQMLLPIPGHRLAFAAKLAAEYSKNFPLVNENFTAFLGIVGAVGLILIIVRVLAPAPGQSNAPLQYLSSVTVFLVLCATIGGFAAVMAVTITPEIRGWNRISIYIEYPALLTSCLMIEALLQRLGSSRIVRFVPVVAMLCVMAVGVLDETPVECNGSCRPDIVTSFRSDRAFVSRIEATLPSGAAVYELPYIGFPEAAPVYSLDSYREGAGYIYSSHLKWSWGGIRGREGDDFFAKLARLPIDAQVDAARRLGFAGIYVDRRGFSDNGAALEAELGELSPAGSKIESDDGTLFFYPISNPAPQLPDFSRSSDVLARLPDIAATLEAQTPVLPGPPACEASKKPPVVGLGERVAVTSATPDPGCILESGWSVPEDWGTWTIGGVAELSLTVAPRPMKTPLKFTFDATAFSKTDRQTISIYSGTTEIASLPVTVGPDKAYSFVLPQDVASNPQLRLEFRIASPVSPKDLGQSDDDRPLGLGLHWVEIDATSP